MLRSPLSKFKPFNSKVLWIVVLLALLCVPQTIAQKPDTNLLQLVNASDGFALGTVGEISESEDGVGFVVLMESIEVSYGLGDEDPEFIALTHSDPAVDLMPGERILVLLTKDTGEESSTVELLGGAQGVFRIMNDVLDDLDRDFVMDHDRNYIFGLMNGHLITESGVVPEPALVGESMDWEGDGIPAATIDLSDREPIDPETFMGFLIPKASFDQHGVQGQILAQATCTALRPSIGWTFSVQRRCSSYAPDCAKVCNYLYERQAGWLKCFNSLHLYSNQPASTTEQLGLKTYKYNGCYGNCGPNYCCCGN